MSQNLEDCFDDAEIAALAFRYLDRTLDEGERESLCELLRTDASARGTFVRCLLQTAELEELLASDRQGGTSPVLAKAAAPYDEALSARPTIEDTDREHLHSVRAELARSPARGDRCRFIDRVLLAERGRVNAPVILASIVAAMVLGAGIGIWLERGDGRSSESFGDLVAKRADDVNAPESSISTAVLVNVTNCRWDRTRSTADLAGGGLKPGQSLHLLEGLAEIQTTLPDRGTAKFQIEGPSAITLTDDGMPNLMFGRLSGEFHYRRDAFRLGTALGEVVIAADSSIGIFSTADEVELHVFRGAATLDLWTTAAAADSNRMVKADAGSSVHVHIGADGEHLVERGAASESKFVTPASLAASQLVISDQYVSAVRGSRPIAYWRFEDTSGGLVRNEMDDRFHLRMGGDAVRLRSTRGTQCAEFGIAAGPGYMMTDDVFDGVIEDDYTVEFWAKPSCFHHGALFSLIDWAPDVNPKGRHRMYLEFCGPREWDYRTAGGMWESDPGRVLFINGRSEVYSSTPYAVRQWQHVVASCEGSEMKLYLDGQVVLREKTADKLGNGLRVLMGQLYPPTRQIRDEVTARLYSGELDEVALYDRALSDTEINYHIQLVKQKVPPARASTADDEPHDSI